MGKWTSALSRPIREIIVNRSSPVKFHHFWDFPSLRDLWFYRFIMHRRILEKANVSSIDFYSVFGNRYLMNLFQRKKAKAIFFTGENLENYPSYKDHMLNQVDLAIGFEHLTHPKYLRFPLWLLYIIQPEWGLPEIKNYIEQYFHQTNYTERNGFCCLVASHDRNGIRKKLLDEVSQYGKVDSSGKIYNNTNILRTKFGNVKSAFLKQYQLNICPENSNTSGYVTEKLFQALESGCIPLYWGSDNKPEPEILNPSSIWFYSEDPNQKIEFRQKLNSFKNDASVYENWCAIPKFLPGAPQVINSCLDRLEERLLGVYK